MFKDIIVEKNLLILGKIQPHESVVGQFSRYLTIGHWEGYTKKKDKCHVNQEITLRLLSFAFVFENKSKWKQPKGMRQFLLIFKYCVRVSIYKKWANLSPQNKGLWAFIFLVLTKILWALLGIAMVWYPFLVTFFILPRWSSMPLCIKTIIFLYVAFHPCEESFQFTGYPQRSWNTGWESISLTFSAPIG